MQTRFDSIKAKSLVDLAKYFKEISDAGDASPWILWFDTNFCQKCPSVTKENDEHGREYAYCELSEQNCCRYFPNRNMLDEEEIIQMWLDSPETTD